MTLKRVVLGIIIGIIGVYSFAIVDVLQADAFFYENSDTVQFHVTQITSTSLTFYYEGKEASGLIVMRSNEGEYIYKTIRNRQTITVDNLHPGMPYMYEIRFDGLQYLTSGGQEIRTLRGNDAIEAVNLAYISPEERFLQVTAREYDDMKVNLSNRFKTDVREMFIPSEGISLSLAPNDIYSISISSSAGSFTWNIFTHNPLTSDFLYSNVTLTDDPEHTPNKIFTITFNQVVNVFSIFITDGSRRVDEYIDSSLNNSSIVIDSRYLQKRLESNTRYYYRINGRLNDARDGNTTFIEGTFVTGSKVEIKPQVEQSAPEPLISFEEDVAQSVTSILEGKSKVLQRTQQQEDHYKENLVTSQYSDRLRSHDQSTKEKTLNFITYGIDGQTMGLGVGERAAVVLSYQEAFNKLPQGNEDWLSVIHISHGRWPLVSNEVAELEGRKKFLEIYKRVPNMHNKYDEAAVTIITYGLKQRAENRNLNSEAQALKTYRAIFNKMPVTTQEWNMLQAIAYSGATRKPDSDKDLLADEDELVFGTNPFNSDTDGDGYLDGIEVLHGYSPTNPA